MMRSLVFFLFVVLFSNDSWSTSHLIFMGGSGDPPGQEDTLFDLFIKNIASYAQRNPEIKTDIALNGGHYKTEKLIDEVFPNVESKRPFYRSDFKSLILSSKEKIKKMKKGDQLMIVVASHGSESKGFPMKSHEIALSSEGTITDLDTLEGGELISLDNLQELKDLAKLKGVKMAIIDTSCHSGSTLALADDNTCVVSSTGPLSFSYFDKRSYRDFQGVLFSSINKGKNLEEAFLDSRLLDKTVSIPMISTEEGLATNFLLSDQIYPFLYTFEIADKLTPYLIKEENGEVPQCSDEVKYNSLIELINRVDKVKNSLMANYTDFTKLKSLLFEYRAILNTIKEKRKAVGSFHISKKIGKYTIREYLNADFRNLIEYTKEQIDSEEDKVKKNDLVKNLKFYIECKEIKEKILLDSPELSQVYQEEDYIKMTNNISYDLVNQISLEEHRLYSILYNKYKKENQKKENPCRSFKL